MAILITGSTGYIGSLLTLKLADQGEDIRILVRKDPELAAFNRPNIKIFKGDITDPRSLETAMQGVDKVYHMAAYARLWAKDPDTFQKADAWFIGYRRYHELWLPKARYERCLVNAEAVG